MELNEREKGRFLFISPLFLFYFYFWRVDPHTPGFWGSDIPGVSFTGVFSNDLVTPLSSKISCSTDNKLN
ncbi:Uncharacterized protein APZ42_030665 [Daphnia magna]|uniref:Uncharacterized protein n=1 Tax=Daphnia magna TaxID=35525 RepID=A0A164NQJ3_9CRUS|nr:Uncharacterized protein APZ42_030665 [Daphnia magna]